MATENTKTNSSEAVDQLKADLETLRKDLAQIADSVKSESKDKLAAGAEQARKKAQQTRKQAEEAAQQVGQKIEENPLVSILVAFGLGFLVGLILDRR